MTALREFRPRLEITLFDVAPPRRLAPFAYALGGTAALPPDPDEVASGRLIMLHDPAGQPGWQGTTRMVCYVTAELEPDLAADPLLAEVGWSWLTDALAGHAPDYTALAGTVTQTSSTRFGALAGPPPSAEVEIRASWTPTGDDPAAHLAAWCALLAATAGLPPPGVSVLPDRSGGRWAG